MKNTLIAIICILIFAVNACTPKLKPEPPVFKFISNVKVEEVNLKNIRLTAEAVLFNPNKVSATVQSLDVDVIANGVNIGKVSQEVEAKAAGNSDFIIPLIANIPPEKIFQKGGGFIGGLLSALTNKEIATQYQGTIRVKILGIGIDVPVDNAEVVPIRK